MAFASRFLSKSKQLCTAQNMILKDHVNAIRYFAKGSPPARRKHELSKSQDIILKDHVNAISYFAKGSPSGPRPLKGDEILTGIFSDLANKFEVARDVFRKERIIIDPDDPAAVKRYAEVMEMARQKAGIMSVSEKINHDIEIETKDIPDVRGYLLKLQELRLKRDAPDELGIEAMQFEALEKVEKVIKKPLMRNDKKGMDLLHAEYEKGNKRLGISKADLPKYEEELNLKIAKEQLVNLKKEIVDGLEAHLNKEEFKDEEMPDIRRLDVRNFL